MTITEAKNKVLAVAISNLGYHEVGDNGTKFTEGDWDNKFYGWELYGQPWCDVYADYCYCAPFGIDLGKKLTYQTNGGSALCRTSAQYYKNNNAWFNYPEVGDQVFFYYGGDINHTGIVETVSGNGTNWSYFTTIEGNSADMVARRTYYYGNNAVAGFGRPNWKIVSDNSQDEPITQPPVSPPEIPQQILLRFGMQNSEDVKKVQEDLKTLGYDIGKWGADGDFGYDTLKAVKKFQKDHGLEIDGIVGDQTRAAIKKALESQTEQPIIPTQPTTPISVKVGDKVKVKEGSTYYNSNIKVPQFVLNDTWIVFQVSGERVVINKNTNGTSMIMSPISIKNLIKI